jgi:hypothetical protein
MATWTEGGKTTKCGSSWSTNNYMTTSVGEDSPFKCGQVLLIRNMSTANPTEILVIVVDEVKGYAPNKLNLHKKALGSNLDVGVIDIQITPIS